MGYLDTGKSVIISSPAGSGKTEKLARRYCALLEEGAEVQRILAITFTEKASAEMKERVLRILNDDFPELSARVRPDAPLMRISTIHAFCLKLLKRFSIELGLDPSLDVADELDARHMWTESVYEELVSERQEPGEFFRLIKERGLRGWDTLLNLLNGLHDKRPEIDLAINEGKTEGEEERKLLSLYKRCLERFSKKKAARHLIDFADLELMAYDALSRGPEWHNILYAFDEHTDHVLVDEFQDTSRLQWMIIDKLTEEWRSGLGAKADRGKTPTVFLVGDEKQSIYLFRGADVGVFRETGEKFDEWFGPGKYHYEELRENYRSLPGIVSFINALFGRVMQNEMLESWRTRYSPFEAKRTAPGDGPVVTPEDGSVAPEDGSVTPEDGSVTPEDGSVTPVTSKKGSVTPVTPTHQVELLLLSPGADTKATRELEAAAVADNIKALEGNLEIQDGEDIRPCDFSDMAILLRRRTHLSVFEAALRRRGVPFVVLKGIGFYGEPETALLRDFVYFMVEPGDGHALAGLLRSPLFGVGYPAIMRLTGGQRGRGRERKKGGALMERLRASDEKALVKAAGLLDGWLEASVHTPLSVLMERMLVQTGGWRYLSESQRHANVKKFISMVESFEAEGLGPLEIREKLIRERDASEVAKANVNAGAMNAVRIMTVHAAKGLEFPAVFLPSLDESATSRSGPFVLDGGVLRYEPDSAKRARIEEFRIRKEKDEEEQKRLFYVAATRARDFLSMSAARVEKRPKGWLKYMDDAFGVLGESVKGGELPFEIIDESAVAERLGGSSKIRLSERPDFMDAPVYVEPIRDEAALVWRDVTEGQETGDAHGDEWKLLGSAMHGLLEEISRGITGVQEAPERAEYLLRNKGLTSGDAERLRHFIVQDIQKLDESGYMKEIIMPMSTEAAFTELPFHLEEGGTVYKGRIDRVIVRGGEVVVYDYKTFPVRAAEIPGLVEKYSFQMGRYARAAARLFKVPAARSFLLFTHVPKLVETPTGASNGPA